jgi:hypothetical protein
MLRQGIEAQVRAAEAMMAQRAKRNLAAAPIDAIDMVEVDGVWMSREDAGKAHGS